MIVYGAVDSTLLIQHDTQNNVRSIMTLLVHIIAVHYDLVCAYYRANYRKTMLCGALQFYTVLL